MTTTAAAHQPRRDTATFSRAFLKKSGLGEASERFAGRNTSRDQSTHLLESSEELVVADPVGKAQRDRRELVILPWQRRMVLSGLAGHGVVDWRRDPVDLRPLELLVPL